MFIPARTKTSTTPGQKIRSRLLTGLILVTLVTACAEVVPILTSAALQFGKNLVDTASQNAGARYGSEVEQLIMALAYKALRVEEAGSAEIPDLAQAIGSFAGAAFHKRASDPYADETFTRGVEVVGAIELDAALLAKRKLAGGGFELEPVNDGDTLVDGRGDPVAGDKIKVNFKTSCDCYVYVIGIDATGYVAQIFPDPDSPQLTNPVTANRNYMLPEGDDWWALDDYRGTETIYFVASPRQRNDIEEVLAKLAGQPRSVSPASYQPVTDAAVVPLPRGLVKVTEAEPIQVPTGTGEQQTVTPTAFLSNNPGADLVITRWFYHK